MSYSSDLPKYFTNRKDQIELFENLIKPKPINCSPNSGNKNIIIILGIPGVGKSALLEMFREISRREPRTPDAISSGNKSKSAIMILCEWAEDLESAGVRMKSFKKILSHYQDIQAKAAGNGNKTTDENLSKLAGLTVGQIMKSFSIPFIPDGVEAGVEHFTQLLLNRGISRNDSDFLRNPDDKFTEVFLDDIENEARARHLVLMLDEFEKLTTLEEWLIDFAKRIPRNVIFIIAGRQAPRWGGRCPPTQLVIQPIEELKTAEIKDLITKYLHLLTGNQPNLIQVNRIAQLSCGLPMAAMIAIEIWANNGYQNFSIPTAEIFSNIAILLTKGISDPLGNVLKTACILRSFNKSMLEELIREEISDETFDDLTKLYFVHPSGPEGYMWAIHDSIRDFINEKHRMDHPDGYSKLHKIAAEYFMQKDARSSVNEGPVILESLYHSVMANETKGMKLFQENAGNLTRLRLIGGLQALLNDASTYPLIDNNSCLWREYWNARLKHLKNDKKGAMETYEKIYKDKTIDTKLRAYALTDLVPLLFSNEYFTAANDLDKCLNSLRMDMDSKLAIGRMEIAISYRRRYEMSECTKIINESIEYYKTSNDIYGLVTAQNKLKEHYFSQGLLKEAYEMEQIALNGFASFSNPPMQLKADILGGKGGVYRAWYGRFYEAEKNLLEALEISKQKGMENRYIETCDLGYALGMQDKYEEAEDYFKRSTTFANSIPTEILKKYQDGIAKGFMGAILMRKGDFPKAEEKLNESLDCKKETGDYAGIPEIYIWLGQLYEIRALRAKLGSKQFMHNLDVAGSYYGLCFDLIEKMGRYYLKCGAHTGFARVKYYQCSYSEMQKYLDESNKLAKCYQYYDLLASQSLIRGHCAWDGLILGDVGFDKAREHYKNALIYSVKYNRFLLDEVLSGRERGTPLRPIIPQCCNQGKAGKEMLGDILEWWTDKNEIIPNEFDSKVSPIPIGISLLEAERFARDYEKGTGLRQRSVEEQLKEAISKIGVS